MNPMRLFIDESFKLKNWMHCSALGIQYMSRWDHCIQWSRSAHCFMWCVYKWISVVIMKTNRKKTLKTNFHLNASQNWRSHFPFWKSKHFSFRLHFGVNCQTGYSLFVLSICKVNYRLFKWQPIRIYTQLVKSMVNATAVNDVLEIQPFYG